MSSLSCRTLHSNRPALSHCVQRQQNVSIGRSSGCPFSSSCNFSCRANTGLIVRILAIDFPASGNLEVITIDKTKPLIIASLTLKTKINTTVILIPPCGTQSGRGAEGPMHFTASTCEAPRPTSRPLPLFFLCALRVLCGSWVLSTQQTPLFNLNFNQFHQSAA